MIRIQLGKKRYHGVYLWRDMTLEQYILLAGIQIPERYQKYALSNERLDYARKESLDQYIDAIQEITEEDLTVTFPNFYRRVIESLSDMPHNEATKLKDDQAAQIFDFYFRPFVLSLIFNTPVVSLFGQIRDYEPETRKLIRIGRHFYHFPKTLIIQGEEMPLAKELIVTYAEACDLFRKAGGFTREDIGSLPLLMAIYCRRQGEEYEEKRSLERIEIFKKATMDQVWSLFFYTSKRLPGSGSFTLLFLTVPKAITKVARATTSTYSETVA